jgi:hypothetical protein
VAEGDKVVHRLLASSLEIISVSSCQNIGWRNTNPRCVPRSRRYFDVQRHREARAGGTRRLRDVSRRDGRGENSSPRFSSSDLRRPRPAAPRLFAAADGLTSAENVGVLVRNCVAFGASKHCSSGRPAPARICAARCATRWGRYFNCRSWRPLHLVGTACRNCGSKASAVSPRIRTRTSVYCTKHSFQARTFASCSELKATAFPPPCWPRVMKPWPSRCRPRRGFAQCRERRGRVPLRCQPATSRSPTETYLRHHGKMIAGELARPREGDGLRPQHRHLATR